MKDLAALLSQHCMHTVKRFLCFFFTLQNWLNTFLNLLSSAAHRVLLLLLLKKTAKYR